jgi:hypothetical protein
MVTGFFHKWRASFPAAPICLSANEHLHRNDDLTRREL